MTTDQVSTERLHDLKVVLSSDEHAEWSEAVCLAKHWARVRAALLFGEYIRHEDPSLAAARLDDRLRRLRATLSRDALDRIVRQEEARFGETLSGPDYVKWSAFINRPSPARDYLGDAATPLTGCGR